MDRECAWKTTPRMKSEKTCQGWAWQPCNCHFGEISPFTLRFLRSTAISTACNQHIRDPEVEEIVDKVPRKKKHGSGTVEPYIKWPVLSNLYTRPWILIIIKVDSKYLHCLNWRRWIAKCAACDPTVRNRKAGIPSPLGKVHLWLDLFDGKSFTHHPSCSLPSPFWAIYHHLYVTKACTPAGF